MANEDLGALLAGAARRVIDEERPLLLEHGLSMWGYVALSCLAEAPASSQLLLADKMRFDKTRLISLLDELADAGLITREPDPGDRRARVIALTPAGRDLHRATRRSIRKMERRLLAGIDAADLRILRDILGRLEGS